MHRTLPWLALVGCAPPPAVELDGADTGTAPTGPSISILFPEDGDEIHLIGCVLEVPIIVVVEGVELAPPGEVVEGEAHWHGGPDLEAGYCVGTIPFCEGVADRAQDDRDHYDGTDIGGGDRKLNVELVNGEHQPFDPPVVDSVEVTLIDDDLSCP